ncbi:MAG: DUF5131 family protein [Bacillota bacterium]
MTTIEWTHMPGYKGETWNPLRGCSHVSEGCRNCYAATMAHRFSGPGQPYEGLTRMTPQGARWTGEIRLVPEMLEEPLRWRAPRMVFVNSMSDLFHEAVPLEFIDRVFAVMALTPRHIYQVLTKRPRRMLDYLTTVTPKRLAAVFPVLPSERHVPQRLVSGARDGAVPEHGAAAGAGGPV